MKLVKLTNSDKFAIVDDEDFERVREFNWCLHKTGSSENVKSTNYAKIPLAGFLLNYKGDRYIQIDHKDQNPLNNQKENLRVATASQNMMNRKIQINNTSGFKGVSWDKANLKWLAQIRVNGRAINLGRYFSRITAIKVYNKAALKYHGEFAVLNEIGE